MWKGINMSGFSHSERVKWSLLNIQKRNPLRRAFLPIPHNNKQMNVTFYRIPAGYIQGLWISKTQRVKHLTKTNGVKCDMLIITPYLTLGATLSVAMQKASSGQKTVLTQICSRPVVLWMWASALMQLTSREKTVLHLHMYCMKRTEHQNRPGSYYTDCGRTQHNSLGFNTGIGLLNYNSHL